MTLPVMSDITPPSHTMAFIVRSIGPELATRPTVPGASLRYVAVCVLVSNDDHVPGVHELTLFVTPTHVKDLYEPAFLAGRPLTVTIK